MNIISNFNKVKSVLAPFVPHFVLVLSLLTLVVSVFSISGQGFTPYDDSLRHCAKVISGKPWSEILVLGTHYQVDHNFGWHKLLGVYYELSGTNISGLIGFSVVFLFLCAVIPMAFCAKRPEAWMSALLLVGILYFNVFMRFFIGRPLVLSVGGTLLVLDLWSRNLKVRPLGLMVVTVIVFGLMTYIHGSFYLYIIPVGAFLLAGKLRAFLWLLPCLFIGVFLGLCATGVPLRLVEGQLFLLNMISADPVAARYLVSEFQPTHVSTAPISLVLIFLIIKYLREKTLRGLWSDPVFVLMIGMGVLGFRNARFWVDFGVPSLLLWLAREISAVLDQYQAPNSKGRVAFTAGVCGAFFLTLTADVGNRWDNNHEHSRRFFPQANDVLLQGWFPDAGGIFYHSNMNFFYNTFVANPNANWRYVLGFEPGIMPKDDLAIYRQIQKEGKWDSYQPWINKMKAEDRLVIHCGPEPQIEELEWKSAFPGIWFGRLPKHADSFCEEAVR